MRTAKGEDKVNHGLHSNQLTCSEIKAIKTFNAPGSSSESDESEEDEELLPDAFLDF